MYCVLPSIFVWCMPLKEVFVVEERERERERERDRQTDRQTNRQTDRQTDRQTEMTCTIYR